MVLERKNKRQTIESSSESDEESENIQKTSSFLIEEDELNGGKDSILQCEHNKIKVKGRIKKCEVKLVPVLKKLKLGESQELLIYTKFNRCIKKVLKRTKGISLSKDSDEDATNEDISDVLLPLKQFQALCDGADKCKALDFMQSISCKRIIKLLVVLEKNIAEGIKISPFVDMIDDEEEHKFWMDLVIEKLTRAVDASLVALNILTSQNMHQTVYLENLIDKIILFFKYQLRNTIFPLFDSSYRECHEKDGSKNTCLKKEKKNILPFYNKLVKGVTLLAALSDIKALTDTAVLNISSMSTATFFVDGVHELQLAGLKLITSVFSKYEKHRRLVLDDILELMVRLGSSKRNLRTYRLISGEHIQMLTALILRLIQSVVRLTPNIQENSKQYILDKLTTARTISSYFLYQFLMKCNGKNERANYRLLFENMINDLMVIFNKPEWPAAELILGILGNLLVASIVKKSCDLSLRLVSLDFLGILASSLRKVAIGAQVNLTTIEELIPELKCEFAKEERLGEGEQIQLLKEALLDHLTVQEQSSPELADAKHFYIAQWYQEKINYESQINEKSDSYIQIDEGPTKKNMSDCESSNVVKSTDSSETKKQSLLDRVNRGKKITSKNYHEIQVFKTFIDYNIAEVVSNFIIWRKPFSQSFEVYLKHILLVLMEPSVQLRSKAIKCLNSIVEVDPSVLELKAVREAVNISFLDCSTSVREAAVDLIGRFVLGRPQLIDKYYEMIITRILDTGISVRKRVIKILSDICMHYPEFPNSSEICAKIIRRVNDEEGVQKLVLEVFQHMWFTPITHEAQVVRRAQSITDVIKSSGDISFEWFEHLLQNLFKSTENNNDKVIEEQNKPLHEACTQIIDCLVENILKNNGQHINLSQKVLPSLQALHLFAKIRPELLVPHASSLQPFLSLECQNTQEYQIISLAARTLEIIVPLIENPNDVFLAQLEEDFERLIMQQDQSVILSCVSCLGSIVNNVTRNYKIVRECLSKYYGFLVHCKKLMECQKEEVEKYFPTIKRSLFVVGLLMRFFDFTNKEVLASFSEKTCDHVFELLLFYLNQKALMSFALMAIGSVCVRQYEFMLENSLKSFYLQILQDPSTSEHLKLQVLKNIEQYLQEEDSRMARQDKDWAKVSKQEDLKEMGDVSSGMSSTVIQLYLKEILETYLHQSTIVRQGVMRIVLLILAQGLVHPVQVIPYLICMSTDSEPVRGNAEKQLQDIERRFPGFIYTKAQTGMQLSYNLQQILQGDSEMVRGCRNEQDDKCRACNNFLYYVLRSKQQRRALIISMLKKFDSFTDVALSQMVYLADNVAHFPYKVQDEPLFVIHHIDTMTSVNGTQFLQVFKQALLPSHTRVLETSIDNNKPVMNDDEDDEHEEELLNRVPEDKSSLEDWLTASQGCFLLLELKQYLKITYSLSDSKIAQYSPSEPTRIYEKITNKNSRAKFNPKLIFQRSKLQISDDLSEETRKKYLVSAYLEFKHLLMKLDKDEQDDEKENVKIINVQPKSQTCFENSKSSSLHCPASKTLKDSQSPEKCMTIANSNDLILQTENTYGSKKKQRNGKSIKAKKIGHYTKHNPKQKLKVINSEDNSGNEL